MTLQAPYYEDGSVTIHHGDALDVMATMAAASVQCCVTSPPYWGLRKYDGEQERTWADGITCPYGAEPTIAAYVSHTVEVLRAVRRVLRDDGCVYLILGDTYSNTGHHGGHSGGKNSACAAGVYPRERKAGGIAHKNLCLIPQRVAIAAQDDGWYVRSIIIWAKTAPMPESVRDRPTTAHEYVLMLAKQPRYYYDSEAVREESSHRTGEAANFARDTKEAWVPGQYSRQHRINRTPTADNGYRHLRSVWALGPEPFRDWGGVEHFATFPSELPRRCIMASTRAGDLVLDPFAGSGTTGAVAKSLGRRSILIDRSEEYCAMAARRVQAVPMPMPLEAGL